jgi:aldehyde dehydrogenase (NAD+)
MKGQHLIGGDWLAGQNLTPDINPSNLNEVVGEFPRGSAEIVDQAVAAARAAQPGWNALSIQRRHDILFRAGDLLLARKDEIGRILSREEGKTLAEGIGETVRAGQLFQFFAGELLRLTGDSIRSLRDNVDIEVVREPVGVVGMITPWNYPIAIPAWKIAPALAYGNTVVVKPAELVPATAAHLLQALLDAGLPGGVVNLVFGTGREVGEAIVNHPDVDAISFTGSVATGRRIAAAAVAGNPMKKLQLELGGKNPLVVLDDADFENAVATAVNGAFYSTGQRCTASSRLIVTEGIHDKFVAEVTKRMLALKVGDALDPSTEIGPAVDERQLAQNLSYIEIGQKEGAKLLAGGKKLERSNPGCFFQPAIFTEVSNNSRLAREEVFGPVAAVIRVKNYDQALAVANDTEFGLSSGICTTSLKYASHFKRNSKSGMSFVNLPTAGVDYHVPFGGRRSSSYGSREQGRYAVEFYTSVKTNYTLPV